MIENNTSNVVNVPIDSVTPNPNNRNKHPEDQIDRLAKILEYQGWRHPLIISKQSGLLVVGHGRLLAAKKLGLTEVPVEYQDFETPEVEYAFAVSDNSIQAWAELDLSGINNDLQHLNGDFDLDLLGIKNFVLEPAELLPTGDPDTVPDLPAEPKTRMGDVWVLGRHRLMCGDSTNFDTVKTLLNGNEVVGMVYTDPPYGVSAVENSSALKSSGYRPIENDGSIDVALGAFSIADQLSGHIVFWGGNYFAHRLPEAGSWIIWKKKENDSDQHDFEVAWLSQKGKMAIFTHTWSGFWRDSEQGEKRVHPTQKPVALAEWVFNNYGNPKSVLDLFGGSGSTMIACEKQDRTCFMMELDPKYCDVIVKRWCEFTGYDAIRVSDGRKMSEL